VTGRAVEGAPTLVIEVLSPHTSSVDLGRKRDLYAEHGVPFYWIADPVARTIEAQRLVAGRYQLAARLAGTTPAALPPFDDFLIDPAVVWA
jgi:Uma2 family endonuclease